MRARHALALVILLAPFLAFAQAPRSISLIVTGGTVVTQNGSRQVLAPGAVAIDGADIVDVDTPQAIAARYRAAETIDARGQIVLPGLINTHTHAPMVMYRGLADDLALMDWLQKYIFPAEAKTVSPEMVRVGTRLAALEMIESGTTTFADMYYFEEEIARATREAGLRAVLGQTIIQFPVADAKTPAEGLARAEAFIKAFRNDTPDHAGRRSARDVHARCRNPPGGGRSRPALRGPGADPSGGNRGRGQDRARPAPHVADRRISSRSASGKARPRSPRMASGSTTRTSRSWSGDRSACRTIRRAT